MPMPLWFLALLMTGLCVSSLHAQPLSTHRLPLRVTSELPLPNVPMDPEIDFGKLAAAANVPGVLDPNSITVVDTLSGATVPHALGQGFSHGDRGRVAWVINHPDHTEYEIRFALTAERPPLSPSPHVPLIGTGDLLRYNAGVPRPVTAIYLSRLADLTGDGRPDLIGCWNYARRPGDPWSSVYCHPRTGASGSFEFGDPVRLRYVDSPDARDFREMNSTYMHADLGDLTGNGLLDLVYSPSVGDEVHVFVNTGGRDDGGMPIFAKAGTRPRLASDWYPCRVADLDGDGLPDIVVGAAWLRNLGTADGLPQFASPVAIDAGDDPCFYDVDGDGLPDAVCLLPGEPPDPRAKTVGWRRNLGGTPPSFGPPQPLDDIDCFWCTSVAPAEDGERSGLLVGHNLWQEVTFFEQTAADPDQPRFTRSDRAQSLSAVLALSDQAWPFFCDWDGDGDLDLLIGGGYGWPRILINEGTRETPSYAEARQILADGQPIRLLRNDILGGDHWHNMGYPFPAFVDWDGDGLPDLIFPNETNRIFWFRNIGTRTHPEFGPRQQIICDGYPDSPEARAESARLSAGKNTPGQPYPLEATRPFFWRTGAGFADLTGGGLMDMVTHDGATRKLTLFTQYRDGEGQLRLKKDRPLRLNDGRLIDDAIVEREQHWTERFSCVDWDGDGLIDIVYGCAGSRPEPSIFLLRNCGTATDPVFEPPVTLCCFGEPIKVTNHGPHPWVGDLTGDGRPDIVTCVEWSVYPVFTHAALTMGSRPEFELGPLSRAE